MIILDSDDDKEWSGKGVVVQHGCLVLIKDANFYHEIELYPGRHVIEIFGRKRTGQPALMIEILDDSIEAISEFSADFEKSFLFKFEFNYKKTSKGYIRIFRPEKNFGTLELVKVIINNLDLKEDFLLEKERRKKEQERERSNAKTLIINDKKSKIEISKEEERESRRLREVKESPRLQRYQRNNIENKKVESKSSTQDSVAQAAMPNSEPIIVAPVQPTSIQVEKNKIEVTLPVTENTIVIPTTVEVKKVVENKSQAIQNKESDIIPEHLAARMKQREERLSSRLRRPDAKESDQDEKEPTAAERIFEVNRIIREKNILKKEEERIARQEYLKSLELEKNSKKQMDPPIEVPAELPPPLEPEIQPSRPPVSSRNLFKNRIQGMSSVKNENSVDDGSKIITKNNPEDNKE